MSFRSRINQSFSKVIQFFTYAVTRFTPKRNIAVLRGFPSFDDNMLAVYEELVYREVGLIVWVVDDPSKGAPLTLLKSTKLVKRGGVLDLFYSITSKFIFITHGHFLRKTPVNQVSVNLWHGIPFKAIGKIQGGEGRSDTLITATSKFTQKIFAQSFGVEEERVKITGQARTDRMINANRPRVLRAAFPGDRPPKFVFFWLPTFRRAKQLGDRCDGADFHNVFNCSDFSLEGFNNVLQEHDAVCLVKPHPMASKQHPSSASNVLFIDEGWLETRGLSLYELIGVSDSLISDISSVIADFLLLDKPVILLFEDIDEYKKNRGFSFNPITDYLPAEVNRNFGQFISDVKMVLSGHDYYTHKRIQLKNLLFQYQDAGATKRILDQALGVRSVKH